MRVLLLEDDAEAAESLANVLFALDARYELVRAASLDEAVVLARTLDLDIALVDLTLPDADGCDAVIGLRDVSQDLPIVVLTARDFDEVGLDLVRCGAQDCLQKGSTLPRRVHEVLQLVAERHGREADTRRFASHDWLTGALSRYGIENQLAKALSRAARNLEQGAVLVIDVDDFKSVNDAHGHRAGDAALKELVARLSAVARNGDSLGRIGGDELALLVEGLKCGEDAVGIAQRVLEASTFAFEFRGREIRLSASIGAVAFKDDSTGVGALLELADSAMYRAKREGKGRFCFHVSSERREGDFLQLVRASGSFESSI